MILYIWLLCFQVKYWCYRTSWCYKGFLVSEFADLLSRVKFSHSSLEIIELSCAVYYKSVDKSCVNHLLQAFHEIYESSQLQDLDQKKILKRFVNCFSKTCVFPESEELKMKQKNSIRCKCAWQILFGTSFFLNKNWVISSHYSCLM